MKIKKDQLPVAQPPATPFRDLIGSGRDNPERLMRVTSEQSDYRLSWFPEITSLPVDLLPFQKKSSLAEMA